MDSANFVMVIEPLSGFDGGIIYFEKRRMDGRERMDKLQKKKLRSWKWKKH